MASETGRASIVNYFVPSSWAKRPWLLRFQNILSAYILAFSVNKLLNFSQNSQTFPGQFWFLAGFNVSWASSLISPCFQQPAYSKNICGQTHFSGCVYPRRCPILDTGSFLRHSKLTVTRRSRRTSKSSGG